MARAHLIAVVASSVLLLGWVTDDIPMPVSLDPDGIDERCEAPRPSRTELEAAPARADNEVAATAIQPMTPRPVATAAPRTRPRPPSPSPTPSPRETRAAGPLPSGRAIGALSARACYAVLREHGVRFDRLTRRQAPGVAMPVRLESPLGGVRITGSDALHSIIDCRLAVSMLAWAPRLRSAGIDRIEHVSIYRPHARVGGGRRVSGHAHALALDALAFFKSDGTRVSVLTDWTSRRRGQDPCSDHRGDDRATSLMRGVVCQAVEAELFQIVLTPHYDDAHANHVHLEIRPDVDWTYVH